jgi:hypothetical protein
VDFNADDEGERRRFAGKCFNCGKIGHKKSNCWAEGGGKAGQGPKGKSEDSTDEKKKMAASSTSTERGADVPWMAMSAFSIEIEDLFEESDLPDLAQLPDSDDDSDSG